MIKNNIKDIILNDIVLWDCLNEEINISSNIDFKQCIEKYKMNNGNNIEYYLLKKINEQ